VPTIAMNPVRIALGCLVAFILLQGSDFLIHAQIPGGYYADSKEIWRPEPEMMSKMWANFVGHGIVAISFTLLFQFAVVSNCGRIPCALIFAGVMALHQAGGAFIMWNVQPLPASYFVTWTAATLVQAALVSIALLFVLPKATKSCSD
jgi:hypothetical protein